jgi:hypothetical protein
VEIVNLTHHKVVLFDKDGKNIIQVYPKPSEPAEVDVDEPSTKIVTTINGVTVVKLTYSKIKGLPEPTTSTVFIVSRPVLDEGKKAGRTDLITLDTSKKSVVRDREGRIVGVRQFTC